MSASSAVSPLTNVPRPTWRCRVPSLAIASTARRSVLRATPYCAASSRSAGSRPLVAHSPEAMRCATILRSRRHHFGQRLLSLYWTGREPIIISPAPLPTANFSGVISRLQCRQKTDNHSQYNKIGSEWGANEGRYGFRCRRAARWPDRQGWDIDRSVRFAPRRSTGRNSCPDPPQWRGHAADPFANSAFAGRDRGADTAAEAQHLLRRQELP